MISCGADERERPATTKWTVGHMIYWYKSWIMIQLNSVRVPKSIFKKAQDWSNLVGVLISYKLACICTRCNYLSSSSRYKVFSYLFQESSYTNQNVLIHSNILMMDKSWVWVGSTPDRPVSTFLTGICFKTQFRSSWISVMATWFSSERNRRRGLHFSYDAWHGKKEL